MRVGLVWPDRWSDDSSPTGWVDDRVPPWWEARGLYFQLGHRLYWFGVAW